MSEGEDAHAPEPEVALESDAELLSAFVRTRDPDLREELAARYMPMAERLASRYRNRGEQQDDLEQVAMLGLLKALDGFDDRRGTSFEAYAAPTILGELRRHFRDNRWTMRVPRDLKEAIPRIRAAIEELAGEEGKMPAAEEIAERIDMEEEQVLEALEAADASRPRSLDAPPPGTTADDPAPLGEQVGDEDQMIEQTEYGIVLERRLERLSDRDREVLYLRFARDLTQSEIADRVGVSQMQISRIIRGALERLRKAE